MGAESSSLQNAATSTCHGCKNWGADRPTDTVKVDMSKIQEVSYAGAAGKENNDPGQMRESPAAQQEPYAVGLQNAAAAAKEEMEATIVGLQNAAEKAKEEARQRAEEDARQRAEEERKLDERQRELEIQLAHLKKQQKEEKERLRVAGVLEEEEEEGEKRCAALVEQEERSRTAKEEEEQQRKEQEWHLRKVLEEEEEEEEARRREAEKEEDEHARMKVEILRDFLEKTGFQGANEKKTKKVTSRIRLMGSSGFSYPLHAAVEARDAEAVEALLWAGADPSVVNSKKQTPLQLAEAKNKEGSHSKVIVALCSH